MDKVLLILLEVVLAAFHVLQLSAEGYSHSIGVPMQLGRNEP
jgi:hypothetical protein